MAENGIVVSQPQVSGLNMFANQESFNTGYKMAQILSSSTIIPDSFKGNVTPFVGVWIETAGSRICLENPVSHPSWVCGLKLSAWVLNIVYSGHTLRGCVD